jgi:Ser/Thr protein kinase RdoA (MazF antagonist)
LIDPYRRVVSGILDFGDAIRAPRIVDVAVAASYQITSDVNPTAGAIDLIVGYHQIEPLLPDELSVLYDLILMRLILRIVITEWRASLFPADRPHIVRNIVKTWAHFNSLQAVPRSVLIADIVSSCGVIEARAGSQ